MFEVLYLIVCIMLESAENGEWTNVVRIGLFLTLLAVAFACPILLIGSAILWVL